MKPKTILFIAAISTLIFTGCQNNDLSADNTLSQNANNMSSSQNNSATVQNANTNNNIINTDATYSMEELSAMVDEYVVSVGSATPDINNSGNLDQFFSLKREADQIGHALENYENSLENQYRSGTISREEYRNLDREIEKLEELLDSAFDRLEIAFGIDD